MARRSKAGVVMARPAIWLGSGIGCPRAVAEIVEAAVAQFVAPFMTKRASRGGGSAGTGADGDSEGMRRWRAEREEA